MPCKDPAKRKELASSHYQRNKDYYKQKTREARARRQAWLREQKNKPCTDCGIQYPFYVMQFDHLHSKEFSLSSGKNYKGRQALQDEISKCEVVCANCHAERTWQRKPKP